MELSEARKIEIKRMSTKALDNFFKTTQLAEEKAYAEEILRKRGAITDYNDGTEEDGADAVVVPAPKVKKAIRVVEPVELSNVFPTKDELFAKHDFEKTNLIADNQGCDHYKCKCCGLKIKLRDGAYIPGSMHPGRFNLCGTDAQFVFKASLPEAKERAEARAKKRAEAGEVRTRIPKERKSIETINAEKAEMSNYIGNKVQFRPFYGDPDKWETGHIIAVTFDARVMLNYWKIRKDEDGSYAHKAFGSDHIVILDEKFEKPEKEKKVLAVSDKPVEKKVSAAKKEKIQKAKEETTAGDVEAVTDTVEQVIADVEATTDENQSEDLM